MLNYVQVLEAPGWFITHFSKNFSVPLLPSKELPSVHTPAAHRHLSHCGSAARRICGCLVWDSGAARCPLDWDWRRTSPPKAPRSPSRNDRTVWDIHYVLLGLQVIVELWGIFEICWPPFLLLFITNTYSNSGSGWQLQNGQAFTIQLTLNNVKNS